MHSVAAWAGHNRFPVKEHARMWWPNWELQDISCGPSASRTLAVVPPSNTMLAATSVYTAHNSLSSHWGRPKSSCIFLLLSGDGEGSQSNSQNVWAPLQVLMEDGASETAVNT